MIKLRILIVDDEPLARERLRAFLGRGPALEIVGECGNGHDAIAAVLAQRPNLVFLDIQMPGCDGLEVVNRLPAEERPAIVFVTAHERFAVEAFTVHAIDYLLKPFDRERLQLSLARASASIESRRHGDISSRFENLLAASRREAARIAVRSDGRIVLLRPADIIWVEAANNYCILHLVDGKRLMLRDTLSALEERFGAASFTRVNRSALVHLDQIKELQPTTYGDYIVVLRNGHRLSLSRSLRGRLERLVPGSL